ncbi:hypothetical protein [Streptomyces goshikiensis]|uniref:hypothetical protein n=1 Tax=Streptomyces goshikiensis TaxID=1942 RepID=UPI00379608A3
MTGSLMPEDPASRPLHRSGGDAGQAERVVMEVLRWYNARLTGAREAGLDAETVDGLRAARDQAADDLDRLDEADEDATVQIGLAYAARLKELTSS